MHTKRCDEETCKSEIIFLKSNKSGKFVPVDLESLTDEDSELVDRGEEVEYDASKGHISHFTTCTKPRRFSKK